MFDRSASSRLGLRLGAALCFLLFCGEPSSLRAASPSLGAVQPRGGQRGTEAVLTFAGGRLADTQEVLVYYPGISVKKLEVVNDGAVRATVAIAPDCRLGEHAFRLRTASGVSDLRTFWVGALPAVDEKEPNTEFDKAQPIPLNVTVHGVVDGEDADHFVVEGKKGQRLSVEVEGQRLGGTFFDPFVAILNDKRFELATGDDAPATGQDGGCSVVLPADGKYTVLVRDSSNGGNGNCQYRLHVGTFPRPTAVVPAGGRPGEELEVTFVGDPLGPVKQKVKLPPAADPLFRAHCQTPDGVHPAGFKFRVIDLPNTLGTDANTSQPAAVPGPAPGAFNGVIGKPGENKHFKFPAKKGQVFDLQCYARRLGSPLDPVMHVGVLGGAYIAGADDTVGPDCNIRFTAPEDKEYVVWVHDHLQKGGPDYFFRVEVTPVAPTTSTGIPKVDGNNVANQDRQSITVPKGNRFATLVNVNRADWGGPAVVSPDKLPPGVKLDAEPCDPGLGQVPVVFEAAADAAPAGVLADLRAVPADANLKVPTRTDLDVNFNIGLNNTPFHRLVTDRVAVAVTEAAPFKVEVVEPKVPLAQNGTYNLKVQVKRENGFKGVVTVYPLFTPPGLGIQGSAAIPENATETVLPMNAAPNAAPRKWRTAVIAVGDAGKGPVWVSSQLFTVEVAPPPVTVAMERPAVEQGGKADLFCKVAVAAPFEGKAKLTIYGLPAKVTAPVVELTKDTKELAIPLTTDKASPAGKHGGIFCQVVIDKNGEQMAMNTGGTELRIDVPLPPKAAPAAPAAQANPMPQPAAPQPAPEKRLTRLEQLRKDQEEREKAGQPASKEAPKKP